MTPVASYALVTAGTQHRLERSVRAVEKIRPRAHFNGEHDERRSTTSWICVPYERRDACRSGTDEIGSLWDGRILTSEFAAQVLGQAMVSEAPKSSPARTYGRPLPCLTRLFDKNA